MATSIQSSTVAADRFVNAVESDLRREGRLGALFAVPFQGGTRLSAILSSFGAFKIISCNIEPGHGTYPALSAITPAANWYERQIFDLHGLMPANYQSLDPLVIRKGLESDPTYKPDEDLSERRPDLSEPSVEGEGLFKIPLGPVRSGIFESIEYVIETPGEEILHVEPRPFYKHRGIENNFSGRSFGEGALLAERVEGVSSVAHAIAYCQAIEQLSDSEISPQAQLVRVIHAELERIANHLESMVRHCEAAAQAVAFARFSFYKEQIMRLRADICGHRFSRGVVSPGGVTIPTTLDLNAVSKRISKLEADIDSSVNLLMKTASFLDRLRGTGVITTKQSRLFGTLGPVARGSGLLEDTRSSHPYSAYRHLGFVPVRETSDGDALARQNVRIDEIAGSFHLLKQALDGLGDLKTPGDEWRIKLNIRDGESLGWAEASQGEVLYLVIVDSGRLKTVRQRSASFHNMSVFSSAFPKDITTDFAFIEASFGLSVAGVSG
ncbi:MAG: NADH-quinone oxidoreductase subunit D [Acidimicrobiaceae bacterium]|nr:NADH-quinone oxidoreductase subunit D [Acidimicrobiaceae bacterium]